MKPLIEFYDSLLESLSCHIDSDTREVSTYYDGEYNPIYIKKKLLIAVNQEIVRNGFTNPSKQIGFHPLSESAAAPQMSEVHMWLLIAIRVRLNELLSKAAAKIMHNALSSELQSKMKPSEIAQYVPLTGADDKTQKTLNDIIDNMDITNANRSMVHLRIKRSGTLAGKSYGRVVYVTFPILEELENNADCIFDVKVRKKDIPIFKALFEDIILNGKGSSLTDFSAANTTTTAPTLSALLIAYYNVLLRLNSLHKSLGKSMESIGLPVDVSWYPSISDFDSLRAMLPVLDGNSGTVSKEESERIKIDKPHQDELSADNFSGLNTTAVEEIKPAAVDSASSNIKNFLRAKPLEGAISYSGPSNGSGDPLTMAIDSGGIDPETLSPEQYAIYRVHQQAYQAQQNNTGQQQFIRGRDMVMHQQNLLNSNPLAGNGHANLLQQSTGQATVVGQASDGSTIIEVNGQLMKASATGGVQQNNQPSPGGGGRFAAFAK